MDILFGEATSWLVDEAWRTNMNELNFDGRPNDTPVGYYTYFVEDDVWSWSDGM